MLNWMQVLWLSVASAGVLLGGIHLLAWLRQRRQVAHLLVAAMSLLVGVCSTFEMRAFLAQTPADYADALRSGHTLAQLVSLVIIAYVYTTVPSRRWLALLASGARVATIAANYLTGVTVSFLSVDGLRTVETFGGASFVVPVGVANPWFALAQLANLLLVAYLIDGLVALVRMPPSRQRRRGVQTIAALIVLVAFGVATGISTVLFGMQLPITVSLALLGFALVASVHLADDLLQASELASHLRISTSSLEEVSNNLRLIEESAGLGTWHWDAGDRRVRVSGRAAQILGREGAGDVGLDEALSTVDPDDWQRVRNLVEGFSRSDAREFSGQCRILTAPGARRWVAAHGRLVRDDGNVLVRAHGVLIDVTDHHSNDVIFSVVFEASPSAMLLVDQRGQVVLANEAAAELSGYPTADLVGTAIDALVPREAQAEHLGHRRRYAGAATRRQMMPPRDVQLLTRDGARKQVEVTLNPVSVDGQTLVIAIIFDMTRRRQQEREQAMHRAALAHVARVGMLAELSGSLAHEINQPLAAILSNAQASLRFIGRPQPELDEVRDGLVQIVDSAKRAGEVIRRLRGMLRNEPPELTVIDARQKVRDVVQLLHSELIERQVKVVEDFADDLPSIHGDRIQLQQVLINLIVNAAEAMTDLSGERTLTLSVRRHADGVLVGVSDVGSGIPADDLERIFQAFVSTKPDGLGFGLPLCRSLVQAHGGRLWASNNEGPGATFHVLLPVAA